MEMTPFVWISIVVFVVVMAAIISEKVHRTTAAILGAVILMITGVLTFDEGIEHVDFGTLGVLIGMMIFVGVAKSSGLFEYLAVKAAKITKGNPWHLMIAFVLITAICSAFLDNVTTVLLVGPMAISICRMMNINPVPYLLTQILASNIGGTATLIGDPPNIMIGSYAGYSFFDFLNYDGLCIIFVLIISLAAFWVMFHKQLHITEESKKAVLELDEKQFIKDPALFKKTVVMLILVALAFIFHGALHLESSIIALTAGGIMLLIGRLEVEKVLIEVEWTTILFFAGLFIVVGGMVQVGIMSYLANLLTPLAESNATTMMVVLVWVSAVASAIVDNIPFVATIAPIILDLQANGVAEEAIHSFWWALSLGACLGGNGTLIGASANVVLASIANREGCKITFMSFLKVGFPMMILTVIVATIYLLIRF